MIHIMRNHLYAFSHAPNPFNKKYIGLTLPLRSAGAHLGLMQFAHSSTRVPVASVQLLCITSVSLTLLPHLQIFFFGTGPLGSRLSSSGLSLLLSWLVLSFHIYTPPHSIFSFFYHSDIFTHTFFYWLSDKGDMRPPSNPQGPRLGFCWLFFFSCV